MLKKQKRRTFLRLGGTGIAALVGMPGLSRLNGANLEDGSEVGLSKQLMVDDQILAAKVNVTRAVGIVTKMGPVLKPTLESDHGASFGFYHTAIFNPNESKFQIWYSVGVRIEAENPYRGVGYAESNDGINWTKPLVSADGKSNIVLPMSGNSVMLDSTLPWGHEEKFKAAWMHPQSRVALSYSPDGKHWNSYNNGNPVSYRAGDTQNQIFWDPGRKAYVLGTRTDLGPGGGPNEHRGWRFMVHEKGGDIRNHPTAWKTILDRIAVNDSKQSSGSVVPDLQFHHIGMWRYEGIWFQLFNVWTAPRQKEYDENDDQTRHERDVSDYYLGMSRDVIAIDRRFVHERQPFVARGAGGTWDDDIVVPSNNIITRGDEHWIYYCGMNERIFNFNNRGRSYVGVAKLPLDRFIRLDAGQTAGTVLTKPFQLAGSRLEVNVDARQGEMRVEVLDTMSQPLGGYSGDDAKTYRNINELRLSPRWAKPLSQIVGQSIRLRFHLRNAGLYSFQLQA